jgi:hypothetical protein
LAIGDYVERLVFDAALVEPVLRFMTPWAKGFDEESDFHTAIGW